MSRITIDRRGGPPMDIMVDGARLTRREIAQEVANFPAATPAESFRAAEQALTLRLALRRRAERLGISGTPEADAEGRLETHEDATLRALVVGELGLPPALDYTVLRAHGRTIAAYLGRVLAEADIQAVPTLPSPAIPADRDEEGWTKLVSDLNRAAAE